MMKMADSSDSHIQSPTSTRHCYWGGEVGLVTTVDMDCEIPPAVLEACLGGSTGGMVYL